MEKSRRTLAGTRCRNTEFRWGERTYVMGVINLSPDSFSGDGLGDDIEAIVAQARRFVAEGADILDVGGESTRPGTRPKSAESIEEELRLVVPAIARLAREVPVPLSVDTYKSEVASRAVEVGANMINDIWGLKRDPDIARVAAAAGVPLLLMSNQRDAPSPDIMAELVADLTRAIRQAMEAGVPGENIIIDPGIGFGKSLKQNLEIIRRLAELKSLGRPILLGTSRKSMIGLTLDLPLDQRVEGTAATVAIGIAHGADMVRVHDVAQMVRVSRMSDAIMRGVTNEL
ncbi:MAG: dihydropteroate synthase [Dehalococcoidales bacterium]|nr:dihydropteroate synthase [Dehalococcoidales bacterium]MDZ4231078.1 dihydropteroate synthase [Dehalococcoidales bacterium]